MKKVETVHNQQTRGEGKKKKRETERNNKRKRKERKKKKELRLWLLGHKPHNLHPHTNQYWRKSRTEALTLDLKRVN